MIYLQTDSYSLDVDTLRSISQKLSDALNCPGDVTIRFTDDETMRSFNVHYRNIDSTTDVLSFPFDGKMGKRMYTGDILISIPRAKEQASDSGHSMLRELLLLILHGLVHLLGYDHETDHGEMNLLENRMKKEFLEVIP